MDVKLCIVCDSAVSASTFISLAMHLIQPMVLRLQEKHDGKLTAGMVTYTTSTTRPAIVTRRAFAQATALFPLFRNAPHLLGIGTTGSGGAAGMAVLEGLIAAIEVSLGFHVRYSVLRIRRCATKCSKRLLGDSARAIQTLSNTRHVHHRSSIFCLLVALDPIMPAGRFTTAPLPWMIYHGKIYRMSCQRSARPNNSLYTRLTIV
jgi:hypothetical protein